MVHHRRLLPVLLTLTLWGLTLWVLTSSAGPALAVGPAPPLLAHSLEEDEEQVTVLLPAGSPPAPAIEILAGESPRVVADFVGVATWGGPEFLEVGSPLVRRVRAWLHGGEARLRVVLDLTAPPRRLLVAHTYRVVPGGVRALLILRPLGPRPRPAS